MVRNATSAAVRSDLAADRALLGRTGTAQRVSDILRERIAEGYFAPGERLSEDAICAGLSISRNTLRESFRLLSRDRLLVHELNRGVFVRRLTVADVIDLYRVRKMLECAAVREVDGPNEDIESIASAVQEGDQAASRHDWQALGTADLHFHQAIAALAGSQRVDEFMRGILAELRLVFHAMDDPRRFHERYLPRNHEILERLEDGDGVGAERLLAEYLDDAERQLVNAYAKLA
ncbi:GntR family transcriptional regulator [Sciscionella sediminilitoris]|uniref:GntR family transcriptional regulator n=1 Tax=Sciscionella sediminilitoris TaxID=1445613 RepID=UPI0004DFB833|nr:GntR family transcriptional regulator [Sciscionella sp. SE31]